MTDATVRRDASALQAMVTPGTIVVASTGAGPFDQIMLNGRHSLRADEPVSAGGGDAGPNPYELLLMSLGSCTSMTVHMYAARKQWPLDQVIVQLRHQRRYVEDCADCDKPGAMLDHIDRTITFAGALPRPPHADLEDNRQDDAGDSRTLSDRHRSVTAPPVVPGSGISGLRTACPRWECPSASAARSPGDPVRGR